MKNTIALILLSLVLFSPVYSEKVHTFYDISKPWKIEVDQNHIYISDANANSVLVYDLENFKLIQKLGKKGEGPKEFKKPPTVHLSGEVIYISDHTKIITFSEKFEFLKEINPGLWMPGNFPVEDHFAFTQSEKIEKKSYTVLNVFNEKFKRIKKETICPVLDTNTLIFPVAISRAWKDKIFVSHAKIDFLIDVYDKQGKKLYSIEKKLYKIKATKEHKKRFLEYMLNFIGPKTFKKLEALKAFDKPLPDFLPNIRDFWVIEDKIYVKTYDLDQDKDKYIILDTKGKILETKYLPKAFHQKFTFSNNRFYYLVDNEEEEAWELHMLKL